jgi:methanogenic corrinoid protein MtbC1/DNA-binding XRE family transcriptional regulator
MPETSTELTPKDSAQFVNDYLKATFEGQAAASQVIQRAIDRGYTVRRILLEILCPAQQQLGLLWINGTITIAQEHIATQISLAMISSLRHLHIVPPSNGLKVLVCLPPKEKHIFAARVLSEIFMMEGWETYFPGPETPQKELLDLIAKHRVDLVALSIVLEPPTCLVPFLEQIKSIKPRPRVIIGGGGAACYAKAGGVDALVTSIPDAISTARKLIGKRAQQSELNQYLATLGNTICSLRKARKMSQLQLAAAADLDRAYLSAIENGKQNVSIACIYSLAHALDIPIESLVSNDTGL